MDAEVEMSIRVTAVVALLVTACGNGGTATTLTTAPPASSSAVTTLTPVTTTTTTTIPPQPEIRWMAWAPSDPGQNPPPPPCGGCSGGPTPLERGREILWVDENGMVWASGDEELIRWDPIGDDITSFDRGEGLLDGTVFSMVQAPDGRLWLATYGGANVWDGSRFSHGLSDDDGLKGETTWSLWIQSDGTVWVATNQGYVLSAFDGTTLRHYSDADTAAWMGSDIAAVFPPFTQFADMAETADGTLWFGTYGKGLFAFDGAEWLRYTEADGLASASVEGLAVTPDGSLWLDVIGGLTRYDGTGFELIDPEVMGAWQGEYPDDLAVGPDGALWVLTQEVVFRYLDGGWQAWEEVDGLAFRGLSSITIGEDGSVWVADLDGVARYGEVSIGG